MDEQNRQVEIRPCSGAEEIRTCAELMSSSEPWLTLGRTFEASLANLSDPSKEIYVAVSDGLIRGFVVINMRGAFIGYIQTVAVQPQDRGRGVGRKLIAFAEERIFGETSNVFMCVSSFNTRAQKLYRALGYTVIGELRDYIVEGHSEILLRKTTGPLRLPRSR